MSKKVNIMAELEDDIYTMVVVPHKRNKTFSKLITTLITGYAENPHIRGYVEDTLDGMRRESSAQLNDLIGSMKEGLASLGVYTEELQSNAQEGIDTFGSVKQQEEASQAVNFDDIKEAVNAETKELRETVDSLKSQNDEIMGMLRMLVSGVGSSVSEGSISGKTPVPKNFVIPVLPEEDITKENTLESELKPVVREDKHEVGVLSEVGEIPKKTVELQVINEELPKEDVKVGLEDEDSDWGDDDEVAIPLQEVEDTPQELNGADVLANLLSGNEYNF